MGLVLNMKAFIEPGSDAVPYQVAKQLSAVSLQTHNNTGIFGAQSNENEFLSITDSGNVRPAAGCCILS